MLSGRSLDGCHDTVPGDLREQHTFIVAAVRREQQALVERGRSARGLGLQVVGEKWTLLILRESVYEMSAARPSLVHSPCATDSAPRPRGLRRSTTYRHRSWIDRPTRQRPGWT